MAYKLFDRTSQEISLHDLQDKGPWCSHGATKEELFVAKFSNQIPLVINPEKSTNIYAPDLLNTRTQVIGDLKTQNTSFFQSQIRYNINPQFAVTFNLKDFKRYKQHYPNIEIYFWVYWEAVSFQGSNNISVQPMEGVWFIAFPDLTRVVENAPVHSYQQRVDDQRGNARDSYVLDLQHNLFTRII